MTDDAALTAVKSLLSALPGPFAVIDDTGACVAATEAFVAAIGMAQGDLVGRRLDSSAIRIMQAFGPNGDRNWRLVAPANTPAGHRVRTKEAIVMAAINALPIMINVKDAQFRYRFMNAFQASYYGVRPEEAVGKTAQDVLGKEYGLRTQALDEQAIEAGKAVSFYEEEYPDSQGTSRCWMTTKVPLPLEGNNIGLATFAFEITRRKELELQLREAERDYRSLFSNAVDGIYRSSLDGQQLRANPALVKLNGYDSEEEMLQAVKDIAAEWYVAPGRREEFMRILKEDGVVTNFVSEIYRHKTRERIWISESARLIRDDYGTPLFYEGTVRDITETRHSEEALRAAMQAAEEASRAKSDFLANISHELRTPLNAIIGFSEIMQSEVAGPVANPVYAEYARHILDSGNHLLALINDILDLSKAEAGRMEIRTESIAVRSVVEACVRTLRSQAEKSDITLRVEVPDDLPALEADTRRVRQMLLNLLSNAVKFTPENGTVTVSAALDLEGALVLTVADTGIGMSPEQIPIALEPFRQLPHAAQRAIGGTGLGLPLTKRLVEMHGGTLEIESALGKGTTVTIRFPKNRTEAHK